MTRNHQSADTEEDVDGDGYGATIFMDVTGPCVPAHGPGSDELKLLGG